MKRPPIVWIFIVLQVLGSVALTGMDIGSESFTFASFIASLVFNVLLTVIFVVIVWEPSRRGWIVIAAWYILTLPFGYNFAMAGVLGVSTFALQIVTILVLLSPWMIRWMRPQVPE